MLRGFYRTRTCTEDVRNEHRMLETPPESRAQCANRAPERTRMMLRGSVVTPAGIVTDGVVEVTDDKITEVRAATPADDEAGVRTGAWIVPGFVDIHVHGGGGFTFTTGD